MRILVVEDEPKVADALSSGLATERNDVRVASTGEDAFPKKLIRTIRGVGFVLGGDAR